MSPSPGARPFILALLLAATTAAGEPTREFATAEQAIAARAWEDAARIWRSEAEAGRPEAYLGLGNLWDLGVLGQRDEAAALEYYRKAAEAGLPVAAFNMGAMYAAGSGTAQDLAGAARWYARAAIAGHDRAAFALGRLHASGDGLLRNPELAAGWLEQAARTIPAATDALAVLSPGEAGALAPPDPLAFQIREENGEPWAEVAWTARPGPAGAGFRVEILAQVEEGQPPELIAAAETGRGAVRIRLPAGVERLVWRVLMIDPGAGDYVVSQWHNDAAQAVPMQSSGLVSFWMAEENAKAIAVADSATQPLRGAGLRVDRRTLGDAPEVSAIHYRYVADAPLARDIARFLPAFGAADATRDPTLDAQPGEIVVVLAFD